VVAVWFDVVFDVICIELVVFEVFLDDVFDVARIVVV